jgi:hypothetical protein
MANLKDSPSNNIRPGLCIKYIASSYMFKQGVTVGRDIAARQLDMCKNHRQFFYWKRQAEKQAGLGALVHA